MSALTKDGRKSHTEENWQGVKRGMKLWHKEIGGPFVVMSVVDGYVMLRRPGCMPLVKSLREIGKWLISPPPT